MNAIQMLLVHKFETLEMSFEEICQDHEELDPLAIKAALISYSEKYRSLTTKEGEAQEDITDAEHRVYMSAYKSLALDSQVDQVKERALKFLINEKKGRNDISKKMLQDAARPINLIVFNENLLKARNAKLKALGLPIQEAEVIEVEKVA